MNDSDIRDDFDPLEEQAIDSLLAEVHCESGPRDFTSEILTKLRELPEPSATDIVCEPIRRPAPAATSIKTPLTLAITLAALAASLMLFFALAPDRSVSDPAPLAQEDGDKPNETQIASNPPETPKSPKPVEPKVIAPREDLPKIAEQNDSNRNQEPFLMPKRNAIGSTDIAMTLVSAEVEADLDSYWKAIEINIAEEASAEESAKRLAAVLGVQLSSESIGDPDQIRNAIGRPRVAKSVARRWLLQVTQGGLNRLPEEVKTSLIDEVSRSVRSKTSFDEMLVGWTSGNSKNASAFYSAVATGGEHQMIRRLGGLTMGVDLRCVQCHDSLIEGTGRQDQYWAFAAFLRKGLKRTPNGWSIDADKKPGKPVYYALMDGRQKVAEPIVPGDWLPDSEPVTEVVQWSKSLVGSPQLARGVVNSLWQLVHGRPLRGRVIDTVTAPHHEALERLEERLASDLVDSGFDVGRTLSLIIASPVSRRSVPEALYPENALASAADVNTAMQAVNAFAAAMPPRDHLPLNRRIDIAMQRIGAKIDNVNSVLAQPNGVGGSKPAPKLRPKVGSDFPGKASDLPVQWLSSIESESSRINHLGYLAGLNRVPDELVQAAKAIRESDQDKNEALTLQRVWWLVRP